VLSVGRNRRTLGALKVLGFTRRQVRNAVAWHATSYAAVALAIALPVGVIVGRWTWRVVAESLGVPAIPIVPLVQVALAAAVVVALANVAAAYPAWRAARTSSAAALRAD
jgi:ABC-type lipoprotein release transport system permease subunit